jgi:glioma pathogenesis-related protein 2
MDYNFKKPGYNHTTKHFTQLVWKGTKLVGFGLSVTLLEEGYAAYVVAHYSPAGNVNKHFRVNVLIPKMAP